MRPGGRWSGCNQVPPATDPGARRPLERAERPRRGGRVAHNRRCRGLGAARRSAFSAPKVRPRTFLQRVEPVATGPRRSPLEVILPQAGNEKTSYPPLKLRRRTWKLLYPRRGWPPQLAHVHAPTRVWDPERELPTCRLHHSPASLGRDDQSPVPPLRPPGLPHRARSGTRRTPRSLLGSRAPRPGRAHAPGRSGRRAPVGGGSATGRSRSGRRAAVHPDGSARGGSRRPRHPGGSGRRRACRPSRARHSRRPLWVRLRPGCRRAVYRRVHGVVARRGNPRPVGTRRPSGFHSS